MLFVLDVGCTFHPRICDGSKVEVIDDFSHWVDPEHVIVKLNEMKTLRFDVRHAGPGQFVKGHLKVNGEMPK